MKISGLNKLSIDINEKRTSFSHSMETEICPVNSTALPSRTRIILTCVQRDLHSQGLTAFQ